MTRAETASTLIVTAHPDPTSLTHWTARRLQELLQPTPMAVAHLAQENFDPRFTTADRRAYLGRGRPDATVLAEQARLDRAEHVVLVFPVHWWSLPALLKGWVDRVFVADWAFTDDKAGGVVPGLGRLTMHLLPLAGTRSASFARHGYAEAFSAQVEQGVIDFCGMQRGRTILVHDSEAEDAQAVQAAAETAAAAIAAAITGATPAQGHSRAGDREALR